MMLFCSPNFRIPLIGVSKPFTRAWDRRPADLGGRTLNFFEAAAS